MHFRDTLETRSPAWWRISGYWHRVLKSFTSSVTACLCVQSCPTLCHPMDYSLPGSSVWGIFQARILEWLAISFSEGSSWPWDWTRISCVSCITGILSPAEPSEKPVTLTTDKRWSFQKWCFVFSSSVQSLSCMWLFVAPWTAAHQASLSITNSRSLLKLMSIESVMPCNHLTLCHSLLLPPSSFPASGSFQIS